MNSLLHLCGADEETRRLIEIHRLTLQDVNKAVEEFSEKFRASHTSSGTQEGHGAESKRG